MPYQAILAIVAGKEADIVVLEAAHAIARHFQSHIDVFFVGELPRPMPCLNAGVAPDFVAALVDNADTDVRMKRDAAHKTYSHWLRNTGICPRDHEKCGPASPLLTASWIEWAGSRKQIGLQGRYADLIVMERPASSPEASSGLFLGGDVESALFESARPVLFVPAEWGKAPPPEKWVALVAWNGSAEAARAVGYALPFLVAAKSVRVFCGMEKEKPSNGRSHDVTQFRRYLSLQVVHADPQQPTVKSSDAGKQILAEAVTSDAELIVMGAFTHSRVRELILGGATKYVLSHAHVPVLMAH